MNDTFEIRSIGSLESSAANLAKYNQSLINDTNSLEYILNAVQTNWQNEAGADLQSYIKELRECINILNNSISPTLKEFSSTMTTLASSAKANQSKTIS